MRPASIHELIDLVDAIEGAGPSSHRPYWLDDLFIARVLVTLIRNDRELCAKMHAARVERMRK